ncbi:MAG TPA: alpha/beta fold hydrolase [Pyrinomonadaceae bacterium]|jgi:pimeloyl-ACP methyl ester carboxylesterase|nr:alpha/beta fold hydrolase [Pyrinomonadaceae bacterium]
MIRAQIRSGLFILFISILSSAAIAQAQERTVTVFGAKIHYLEAGDAANPTVVLLHGLGGDSGNWAFNIAALAAKYHVLAPDQIGFGRSDKPLIGYRIGTYSDFLDKFLTELKIEKATLVGNSLGGWIGAFYALKYPDRVEKLVLVDAAGFAPRNLDQRILQSLNPSTREQVRDVLKLVIYNQMLVNDAFIDAAIASRVSAGDGYTIQSMIESIKRGEDMLDGKLKDLKKPTLIIWGKQDGLLTLAEFGERFKREIAGSELIVYDQCGHAPMLEKAVEFNAALLKFLEKK